MALMTFLMEVTQIRFQCDVVLTTNLSLFGAFGC